MKINEINREIQAKEKLSCLRQTFDAQFLVKADDTLLSFPVSSHTALKMKFLQINHTSRWHSTILVCINRIQGEMCIVFILHIPRCFFPPPEHLKNILFSWRILRNGSFLLSKPELPARQTNGPPPLFTRAISITGKRKRMKKKKKWGRYFGIFVPFTFLLHYFSRPSDLHISLMTCPMTLPLNLCGRLKCCCIPRVSTFMAYTTVGETQFGLRSNFARVSFLCFFHFT